MTKKKEQFDITRALEMIQEIEYDLIFRLQMSVNNSILCEEDCRTLVQLDNKPICYPKEVFNDYNIVKFDPIFNRKLAAFLFQRYIYIYLSENRNIEITSFSIAYEIINPKMMFAVCRTNRGDIISNFFQNETLCWFDLMYKLEGCQYPYQDFAYLDSAITHIKEVGLDDTTK